MPGPTHGACAVPEMESEAHGAPALGHREHAVRNEEVQDRRKSAFQEASVDGPVLELVPFAEVTISSYQPKDIHHRDAPSTGKHRAKV